MQHKEDDEQRAFFDWARSYQYKGKPLSELCFAIPNGGNRNKREAARLKVQGVLAGVTDIFVSIPKNGLHGLYIEMKVDDNALSPAQKIFKQNVTAESYLHVTCYCAEDAIEETSMYLKSEGTPVAYITETSGDFKHKAVCRRMIKFFKTRRGAVGWLSKRGFNEHGVRI